ncbi:hypothetical protein H8S90_11930 [Olivibacter sp. SDN3]|uniref:hypothetical protein n=1 Tax=Olivibacter sp. SDN3 TaxID=2764720 RepID=UPI0016516B14|nr:hypothetical protein [Olivibacter sp. SDN3]QNL52213.1 hypothetical protein H8S90_11930 [Olivibacter sp. SDN3]
MVKAYLEIILTIDGLDRAGVTAVYTLYKEPFLQTVKGALSNDLLTHIDDVQVLHGFDSVENAQEYLMSDLFNKDVVTSLRPYLKGLPNIKIYSVT